LDHYGRTILHGEAVVSGVTIYYAGIRRKFDENCGAHGGDHDAMPGWVYLAI
jgi:hypothetical protein